MIAFYGVMRIGDVLQGSRCHLLLPEDYLEPEAECGFMRVDKPKSGQRGGAKVQHARLRHSFLLKFCSKVFKPLRKEEKLYPFSPSAFRGRWDYVLCVLQVPSTVRLTPGGLRGGGAVAAYRHGANITDLLWQMRLKHLTTLEHYLQEVAAVSALAGLPTAARKKVVASSNLFDALVASVS